MSKEEKQKAKNKLQNRSTVYRLNKNKNAEEMFNSYLFTCTLNSPEAKNNNLVKFFIIYVPSQQPQG
jgi:hypothetical protein